MVKMRKKIGRGGGTHANTKEDTTENIPFISLGFDRT
jgi:hypothetical protein